MRIKLNEIDAFIRIYDGTRNLTLLDSQKYDTIYDSISYLLSLKCDMTYIFSHYFAKIKVDSYDSSRIEKRFILHNVIILIKSILNKDNIHYY